MAAGAWARSGGSCASRQNRTTVSALLFPLIVGETPNLAARLLHLANLTVLVILEGDHTSAPGLVLRRTAERYTCCL
jgi:hypothetical protein